MIIIDSFNFIWISLIVDQYYSPMIMNITTFYSESEENVCY